MDFHQRRVQEDRESFCTIQRSRWRRAFAACIGVLTVVLILVPQSTRGQDIGWLDFSGLDDIMVTSPSGQTFEFGLDGGSTFTVTLRSPSFLGTFSASDLSLSGTPFTSVYDADLPLNESVSWSVNSGGFGTKINLFAFFSQPLDVYVANSGWTTVDESISLTSTGSVWTLFDDPNSHPPPSEITVTGTGTTNLFLTGDVSGPPSGDYMVAESSGVGALIMNLAQNDLIGGTESIAIGVEGAVLIPEPRSGSLALIGGLIFLSRRRRRR